MVAVLPAGGSPSEPAVTAWHWLIVVGALLAALWPLFRSRSRDRRAVDETLDRIAPRPPRTRLGASARSDVAAPPPNKPQPVQAIQAAPTATAPPAEPKTILWKIGATLLYTPAAGLLWSVWTGVARPGVVGLIGITSLGQSATALLAATVSVAAFAAILMPYVGIWQRPTLAKEVGSTAAHTEEPMPAIRQVYEQTMMRDAPHTFTALQHLVMSMADLRKNMNKTSLFGRDKGQIAYSKFLERLKATTQAMTLDRTVSAATSSDDVLLKIVDAIAEFSHAYPNWTDAYACVNEMFVNNAQSMAATIERLRSTP